MSDFVECPCCGYPTLSEHAVYEICPICWWEDDGQGDHDADEAVGGPNGHYSLTQARANFAGQFDMYNVGKGIEAVSNPSPERNAIVAYLASIRKGERGHDLRVLQGLLRADNEARRKAMQ